MSFEKWSEKYAPAIALFMSVLAFICAVAAFMNVPEKMPRPGGENRSRSMTPDAGNRMRGGGMQGMISPEYIKKYQERVSLLETQLKTSELAFKNGALPMDTVWKQRLALDEAKLTLWRLESGKRAFRGSAENILNLKYLQNYVKLLQTDRIAASQRINELIPAMLELNQAELNMIRSRGRTKENPKFSSAVDALQKYPVQPATDAELKALLDAESAP